MCIPGTLAASLYWKPSVGKTKWQPLTRPLSYLIMESKLPSYRSSGRISIFLPNWTQFAGSRLCLYCADKSSKFSVQRTTYSFSSKHILYSKSIFTILDTAVTRFLVDMLDSAIISVTRFLGGRRLSRQLELITPVSSLVKPVTNALGLIPRSYYGK